MGSLFKDIHSWFDFEMKGFFETDLGKWIAESTEAFGRWLSRTEGFRETMKDIRDFLFPHSGAEGLKSGDLPQPSGAMPGKVLKGAAGALNRVQGMNTPAPLSGATTAAMAAMGGNVEQVNNITVNAPAGMPHEMAARAMTAGVAESIRNLLRDAREDTASPVTA